ncbi:MAG: HEPN domain-containing protein [Candidatus Coatesbacteria bacterium]
MARSYCHQAEQSVDQAVAALEKGATGLTVRRAQEAVELALKAALRSIGVEPPKWHDVGEILREHRGKFAAPFAARIDEFAEHSSVLRERRELSLYGNESTGQNADDLFGKPEAEEALGWAREIVAAVKAIQPG